MNDEALLRELRMLAGQVPVGTTSGGYICPRCAGGRTREASFSIRRLGPSTCTFKCYRATCDYHGRLSGTTCFVANYDDSDKGVGKPELSGFSGELRELGDEWLSELCEFTLLDRSVIHNSGFMEEVAGGRLMVPIRGPYGQRRGCQLRASRRDRGRTFTSDRDYRETDGLWMGWFRPDVMGERYPVILVEDVLSAATVAGAGFTAASLMGSHISVDAMVEAARAASGSDIIIALDRDAFGKALRAVSRYECLHSGTLRALLLDKDLKYVDRRTIMKMVHDVTEPE